MLLKNRSINVCCKTVRSCLTNNVGKKQIENWCTIKQFFVIQCLLKSLAFSLFVRQNLHHCIVLNKKVKKITKHEKIIISKRTKKDKDSAQKIRKKLRLTEKEKVLGY